MFLFAEKANALTYGACERVTTTPHRQRGRLFYRGETKLGSFALIISQTFVGGNIGHGKTGELQRPTYVSVLWVLDDPVQRLGKSDRIGFGRVRRRNEWRRRAGYSFVEDTVSCGGKRTELLEKPPRHVVDRANIDAAFIETLETGDMRAGHDDGRKEGLSAGDAR